MCNLSVKALWQRVWPAREAEVTPRFSGRVRRAAYQMEGEVRAREEVLNAWKRLLEVNHRLLWLVPELVAAAEDEDSALRDLPLREEDLALVLTKETMVSNVFSIQGGRVYVLSDEDTVKVFRLFDAALRDQGFCLGRVEYHRRDVVRGEGFVRFAIDRVES